MIQLNRLEGFYWVAREGGYAKAARAFPYPITQPAVHQQVKKLEGEIGAALFERVGKDTIVLTPAGQQLFDFVAPFYTGLPGVLRRVQSGDAEGEIKIQSAPLFIHHLLPPWLRRLQRKHPAITVELSELAKDGSCPSLISGETDLAIGYLPRLPSTIATKRVGTIYAFIVHPANHRLAKRKRVALSDFTGETFLGYAKGSTMRRIQDRELERAGAEPSHVITTDAVDVILGFVASGLGLSLVPSLSPDGPKAPGLMARAVGGKRNQYPVVAAWRKSASESPLLRAVLALAPKVEGS
ncbi:MAG: LysR family transcriptional regulator [Planctomycetota bacterium]|jgi:DNA-binding transcriptional LysR family regulator